MAKKRLLWILNHETLSKFELPLIRDLEFEIYTPKVVPIEILRASGSVTYEYDCTLSIPHDDLQKLNEYNFYDNFDMPIHIKNIINKYFDIAIIMFDFYAIKKFVEEFNGLILTRAFGLGNNITYSDITKQVLGKSFLFKLQQIKDRFWFSQCYENISEIEEGIYKEKSVFMPLGLPSEFYNIENKWVGSKSKLLFFCSRIKGYTESEKIYNEFKANFNGYDYVIAGNQPIPVNDSKVTGYLDRDELNNLYKECKVMFYHSTLPRHVHYHPLEAMIAGMPVVFMDGGLLSVLGGGIQKQSGCCASIKEAKAKINRILNGDRKLIEEIQYDQKEILYKFSYQYNYEQWIGNFLPIVKNISGFKGIKPKSVSIFLPSHQQQHMDDFINIIKVFNSGIKEVNSLNHVNINIPSRSYDIDEFSDLAKQRITVKEYDFNLISTHDIKDSMNLMFKERPLWATQYLFPVDHVQNNIDTDVWLFLDDKLTHSIPPLKKYGLFVQDLGDRYERTISASRISNYKNASFLVTFSYQTKSDLIKHVGIDEDKIFIIPKSYSVSSSLRMETSTHYNLVEIDLNSSKMLISQILENINEFFDIHENGKQIFIHFNNYQDQYSEYISNINTQIQESRSLRGKVKIFHKLGKDGYNSLLASSDKVIIPFYVPNFVFKLFKAASYGKEIVTGLDLLSQEFESETGYLVTYRDFNKRQNILLNVLTEKKCNESLESLREIPIKSSDINNKMWEALLL